VVFVQLLAQGSHVQVLNHAGLPFLKCEFASDNTLVCVGFDMNPTVFTATGDAAAPKWALAKLLDSNEKKADDAAKGATSAAAAAPPRPVRFVTDLPSLVELEVGPGAAPWLVLTDTFLPGWTATVDGAPVPIWRANHSQRVVPLHTGACRVRFAYTCPGLWPGFAAAAAAAATLLFLAGWQRRRDRRADVA
ncbi:MAG: hypothetical protein KF830_18430, partial [Planctomycetes bacterium]|nr:hypothetical protein [Planctomycetota bacterium]